MDPNLIKRALAALRGTPQDVPPATPSPMQAPSQTMPGLDQAYAQPVAPVPQASPSPFQFNQGLENQVGMQGGNNQLEPLLQEIMKRLGMMSMIRNRSNAQMAAGLQG